MTRRYVAMKPRQEWFDDLPDAPLLPQLTVYEPDGDCRPTGLVDHHGIPIIAVDEREPVGFIRAKTRA